MGVALDLSLCVNLLRRREVVLLRVHEMACLHVIDRHLYGECGISLDRSKVLGEREFRGRHVICRHNDTDGGRIAGAGRDLLAIRDGKVGDGSTEVDEVVPGSEGGNLTCGWYFLAVLKEARCDDGRVEGWQIVIVRPGNFIQTVV